MNTCWGKKPSVQGGHGDWDITYCCGPSDTKCNDYTYCSNRVNNKYLKEFTCPIDKFNCPQGSERELNLRLTNNA